MPSLDANVPYRTVTVLIAACSVFGLLAHAADYDYSDRPKKNVQAPDANNFSDFRLGYYRLPRGQFGGSAPDSSPNPAAPYSSGSAEADKSGDFTSGSRVSLMVFGPICSIIPINCFTPARVDSDKRLPSTIEWGDKEGWNFLGGFELSYNHWATNQGAISPFNPAIDYKSYAFTSHFLGLGTEYKCFGACRLQFEGNPFLGAGWSQVSYKDASRLTSGSTPANPQSINADFEGLYYEAGARVGMEFTLPFGLQIGGDVRYLFSNSLLSSDSAVEPSVRVSGLMAGANVGYRW